MSPKLPPNSKGKGRAKAQPEDERSTPTDQSASASQAESEPHEHEAMIIDNVDDGATDGTTPSTKASGKQKVHPPSMDDLDQHLVLTRDGIAHTDASCDNCRKFHDHMRRSHASEKHAALRHVYHERISTRVLQEEFDRGRAEERDRALDVIKERDTQYDSLCDELDKVCDELAQIIGTMGASPSPAPPGGSRAPSRRSSTRNLRAVALTKSAFGPGVVDTLPAPATDMPVADHLAYFRQRPKTQPPWLSAALTSAGEALGGIDAIWNHSLITGAVSGWLIICRLIGTVARGAFWLMPAVLVERIVPLLGNPQSNDHYVAFVRQHVLTFDGRCPANFMYWHTSLQEVVQLEQLTPAFIGWVMTNTLLSAGEAYGVCVYSRFIHEAETRRLILIVHNETPLSWGEVVPMDEQHAPVAVRPPPPSLSSSRAATLRDMRRGGPLYPMAPPPPPSTTFSSTRVPSRTSLCAPSCAPSPQCPAAPSSYATTPLPAPAGTTPLLARATDFADWAGFSSTLAGRSVDFTESTASSSQGTLGQYGPYMRHRGSSVALSFVLEDTILDEDDVGAYDDYEPSRSTSNQGLYTPGRPGPPDEGEGDCQEFDDSDLYD
jgi:hypothetical protein